MIRTFADRATEDVYNGKASPAARRTLPRQLIRAALRKLEQLDSVERLDDLRIPPGNRLEALRGDRKGQHSIRINEIVHGKRSITADTALRLSRYFGTSEKFWLNLQTGYDLEVERDRLGDRLEEEVLQRAV